MIEEPKRSPASPLEQPSFSRESANANSPAVEPESASASPHAALQDAAIKPSMRTELQSAFEGVYRIGEMIDRGQCSATFLGMAECLDAQKRTLLLKLVEEAHHVVVAAGFFVVRQLGA